MRRIAISSRVQSKILPLLTFAILLAGCAIKPIPIAVEVMKPAELDLGPVRKLAVSDFQGPGGSALSNKLVTKLFEGRRFEILERSHLARILDELALSQSGVVDETTAAKVGKAAGVDALIFGEVDTAEVTDEKTVTPLTRSRVVGYRTECGKKKCYQVPVEENYVVNAPTTTRRGHVGASLRVVGVESGQIVASKTQSAGWEGMNVQDPYPPPRSITLPAKPAILEHLTDEVATKLAGVISPHRLKVQTVWLPVDGTEPAFKYLSAGLAREAMEHLEGVQSKSDSHSAPFYYDLGLLYEINGRLDDAETMYKKAAALEMNDAFLKAISAVRQAKEDQKKLREQQGIRE